jgi:hypothetical protein
MMAHLIRRTPMKPQHRPHPVSDLRPIGRAGLVLLMLAAAPTLAGFEDETGADSGPSFFERLLGADKDELVGYADQLDSAMQGRLGDELDARGYGDDARSLWQRVKDWLFGSDDDAL